MYDNPPSHAPDTTPIRGAAPDHRPPAARRPGIRARTATGNCAHAAGTRGSPLSRPRTTGSRPAVPPPRHRFRARRKPRRRACATLPYSARPACTRRTLRALRRATAGARVVVARGSTTLPACALALAFRGTPFVYVNIGDPRHWAARLDQRLRVGAMVHRAAMTASVSPTGRDLLVARYRLPAAKVQAIPNGRRPEAYPRTDAASRAAARKELGIPDDAVVIAVVGALSREKRVGLAIEGFARHLDGITGAAATADPSDLRQRELPDAAPLLLVAGDGPERAELAALADRLAPEVRFLGTVGDAAPVYRAADALLLTSASEGVPGVLVEAGLSGILGRDGCGVRSRRRPRRPDRRTCRVRRPRRGRGGHRARRGTPRRVGRRGVRALHEGFRHGGRRRCLGRSLQSVMAEAPASS
ncbi:glycosyltransferase [Yinghuangia aomiensis]